MRTFGSMRGMWKGILMLCRCFKILICDVFDTDMGIKCAHEKGRKGARKARKSTWTWHELQRLRSYVDGNSFRDAANSQMSCWLKIYKLLVGAVERRQQFLIYGATMWRQKLLSASLSVNIFHFNLSTFFGLTTFHFSSKRKRFCDSSFLNKYCTFMALSFFVLYPLAVVALLKEFITDGEMGITDIARNFVYIGNWLMCALIFGNQTRHAIESCNLYNQAGALFIDTTRKAKADLDVKLEYSAKCAFKTCILTIGFLYVNFVKFYTRLDDRISIFECLLFIYLFVPSVIMVLASNRFYVATSFCSFLIMEIGASIKRLSAEFERKTANRKVLKLSRELSAVTAGKLSVLSENYARLHQTFVDFNFLYAKCMIFILGICFMNVVFEVSTNVWISLKTKLFRQKLYFLYLNISLSMANDVRVDPFFASLALLQIFLYFYEIVATTRIYDNLKKASDNLIVHDTAFIVALQQLPIDVRAISPFVHLLNACIPNRFSGKSSCSRSNYCTVHLTFQFAAFSESIIHSCLRYAKWHLSGSLTLTMAIYSTDYFVNLFLFDNRNTVQGRGSVWRSWPGTETLWRSQQSTQQRHESLRTLN